MKRLHPSLLDQLPPDVARPSYDRAALQPGIVHLGIGAFMRAHLAVATEAAIAASGDLRWGICGVSLRQPDTRDALAPQGGLYTVAVRDADESGAPRQRLQVIGCVCDLLVAPEDPAAVLAAIARPATRIVSLTVTEKAYLRDPASGALLVDHPDITHDLAHPHVPRSALGFIVHGLALRRAQGQGGLTLMSLDNLPSNGHTLQRLVLAFARAVEAAAPTESSAGLADWIAAHCSFPNSMVDRIVPRTTDADRDRVAIQLGYLDAWPVLAEPFFDWAVEDRFVAGRPAWGVLPGGHARAAPASVAAVAVAPRFVPDAAPWERLKLRMVNGAHSAIAYLGAMAGWATVDVAIAQPALRAYIDVLLRDEVAPTLPPLPGLDLAAYRASLLARFANPALAHQTRQIAMDGSQKLPQRLLGTVRERLVAGLPITHLALAMAAWLHWLRGVDEAGKAHAIDDPLAARLAELAQRAEACADGLDRVRVYASFAPVFAELGDSPEFVAAVARALKVLRDRGVAAALSATAGR
ncbi:MAG: mannitol dehydrogenase family protein [Burkholderiales bacterium]|nr:mannitol dehydrogenase family protein [Burkholderiales bacterium]